MSAGSQSSNSNKIWSKVLEHKVAIGTVAAATALTSAGVYLLWKLRSSRKHLLSPSPNDIEPRMCPSLVSLELAIQEITEMFDVPLDALRHVSKAMLADMEAGLQPSNESPLKMIPSYVDKLKVPANGQTVYALDMGGTNLRVMKVRLEAGGNAVPLFATKHQIPQYLMVGSGQSLFDFIAQCVADTLDEFDVNPQIGFTFSFPTKQDSINSGKLVEWTKGFSASDVEGKDVAAMLNASFKHVGVPMTVTALVNDTVGTLLTGAFETQNENTLIGLILGTGSNACYVESAHKIAKWEGEPIATGKMIINIEWGNFDSPVYKALNATKYDVELDQTSLNPGKQHYEKMLSGMYLGEIVRLVLQDYTASLNLFGGQESSNLTTPYHFGTHFMSQIEADNTEELDAVSNILREIGITQTTRPIRQFVKAVCAAVAKRSARLAAAGIAAIVTQMEKKEEPVNVAIDGSVYELYPGYADILKNTLHEMDFHYVTLTLAKDGSGNGAAITAAIMAP